MSGAVPKLRFPAFEGAWSVERLGSRTTKVGSGVTPKGGAASYLSAGIPLIRSQNVRDGRLELDDVAYIAVETHDRMSGSHVQSNDILLNITGASIGRSCIVPDYVGAANVNQHVCIVRMGDDDAPAFIQQYLASTKGQKQIDDSQGGSGREGLNFENIRGFKIPLPAFSEQRKVADFLCTVDARIEVLRQKTKALRTFKAGLMQKLFSQEIRFTRDDGSEFPDWEEMRLGSVFRERSQRGGTNTELLSVTMDRGVVRAVDIGREEGASADTSNYKFVAVGDIAYNSMRMWQGASGLSAYDGIVSPAYTVITPCEDQYPLYWAYRFKAHDLIFKFRQFSQGLTSDTWNLKFPALSAITVAVPHPDEQRKIADALTALDTKITAVQSQITEMEAFKKGLLQQMFV